MVACHFNVIRNLFRKDYKTDFLGDKDFFGMICFSHSYALASPKQMRYPRFLYNQDILPFISQKGSMVSAVALRGRGFSLLPYLNDVHLGNRRSSDSKLALGVNVSDAACLFLHVSP